MASRGSGVRISLDPPKIVMPDISFLLIVFSIGLVASFVGNFVSGGTTLISLSALSALGIPPHLAIATTRFGTFAWRVGGFREFLRAKKIIWQYVAPLSIIAFIGSVAGANILIATNEELLNKIIGVSILVLIPLTLLKKDLGIQKTDIPKLKRYLGYFFYLLVAIWAGFFSAGAGAFFLYIYMYFFGLTILELKGTDKIPGMFLDAGAMIVFLDNRIFNLWYLLAFLPGMFLGSTFGAKYAIKLGDRWLRALVLLSIAIMSAKLLLK